MLLCRQAHLGLNAIDELGIRGRHRCLFGTGIPRRSVGGGRETLQFKRREFHNPAPDVAFAGVGIIGADVADGAHQCAVDNLPGHLLVAQLATAEFVQGAQEAPAKPPA